MGIFFLSRGPSGGSAIPLLDYVLLHNTMEVRFMDNCAHCEPWLFHLPLPLPLTLPDDRRGHGTNKCKGVA